MILVILFFLVLIAPPLFLAVWQKRRFEETVALTTGGMILFMYVLGIVGLLKISVYLILGMTLALLGGSAFLVFRRKDFRRTLAPFFTPTALAFFLLFLFLIYTHYGRLAHEWDEFTHWADVVKAMCAIDDFATSPLSHSIFQNYVPGVAVFQYLFEKIAMIFPGGIFVDWRLYFAYHLLAAIQLLPFLTVRKWRHFLPAFLLILFTAAVRAFFDPEALSSVYVDGILGLTAGAGFALLFLKKSSGWKTAQILVFCALLVLIKDVGMLFAVTLGAAFLWSELPALRGNPRKKTALAALTLAAVGLPKILWEISIRVNGATSMKFRQGIDWGVLFRIITGQETTGYAAEAGGWTVNRLLTGVVGLHGPIGVTLSYPVLAAVLIGLLCLAWYLWRKQDPEAKIRHRAAALGMAVTFGLYCLGMPLLYMFLLSTDETLVSFDRYMGIVLTGLIVMIFLLFAGWMQERPKRMIAGIGACVVIGVLTLNPVILGKYLNRESVGDQYGAQGQYESFVRAMNEITDGEEKHVWIITQESAGYEFWILRYGIRPANGEINVGFSISDHTKSLYPGDIWTIVVPAEEWREKLKDYDYVMILTADDVFREDYAALFRNPAEIEDRTIFAVNHETNLLERVRVTRTGSV